MFERVRVYVLFRFGGSGAAFFSCCRALLLSFKVVIQDVMRHAGEGEHFLLKGKPYLTTNGIFFPNHLVLGHVTLRFHFVKNKSPCVRMCG